MSSFDLMVTVFDAARCQLDPETLRDLESKGDYAIDQLSQMATVIEGIGCYISSDGEPGRTVGTFQTNTGAASLLWVLSSAIDSLATIANVGRLAADHRHQLGADNPYCKCDHNGKP
jgi:hypothetical protein